MSTTATVEPKSQTKATASIEDQLRKWYRSIPDIRGGSLRKRWLKALSRRSMKAAVAAKCEDCMAFEQPEVRRCTIVHCPLFLYRPGAKKDNPVEQAIRAVAESLLSSDSEP